MFPALRKVTAPAASDALATWSPRSGRRIVKDHRGADLTEQLDYEARLAAAHEEHLCFERLVADVAGALADATESAIGPAIDGVLRHIGEGLQLDEAAIWRKTSDSRGFEPLFSWMKRPGTPREIIPSASIPWIASRIDAGGRAAFARISDVQNPSDREWFKRKGTRSLAILPLGADHGALVLGSMTRECEMTAAVLDRLSLLSSVISQALARRAAHEALSAAVEETRSLRERLAGDLQQAPRRELRTVRGSRTIIS